MTRKSCKHPHATYGTAVSTLLGLIEPATPECRNKPSTNGLLIHATHNRRQSTSHGFFCHHYLIWRRLCVVWICGPLVEVQFLHSEATGSISSDGDYGMHCWWDPMRSKKLFSVPYVRCGCLLDFLVMLI